MEKTALETGTAEATSAKPSSAVSTEEFVQLFRRFSTIREGAIFRAKKNRTFLRLTEDIEDDSFSPVRRMGFVDVREGDHILLYKIERALIQNTHYAWLRGKETEIKKNVADIITFYFLIPCGSEVKKALFVFGNESVNSVKLFFSFFDTVSEGLTDEQLRAAENDLQQASQV